MKPRRSPLLILPKVCNQREEVPTNAHSPSHRLRRLASLPIHLNRDGATSAQLLSLTEGSLLTQKRVMLIGGREAKQLA